MKKRFIIFVLLCLTFTNIMFAQTQDRDYIKQSVQKVSTTKNKNYFKGNNLESIPVLTDTTKALDVPLIGGLESFSAAIDNVDNIVFVLCMLGCFLFLVFYAVKLWSGTTELKKFYVDAIYRIVMCIAIFVLYKPVTNYTILFATELGSTISGGSKKVENVFAENVKLLQNNINTGIEELKKAIIGNGYYDKKSGKILISTQTLNVLSDYGFSEGQIDEFLKENNFTRANEANKPIFNFNKKYIDDNGNDITLPWYSRWALSDQKHNVTAYNDETASYIENLDNTFAKLEALAEVLSGTGLESDAFIDNPDEATENKQRNILATAKELVYTPWLKTKDGNISFFISPSAIIKTTSLLADSIALANSKGTSQGDGISTVETSFNPKGVWTHKGFVKCIYTLFYMFGTYLALAIVLCEYVITIIEFYLLRAVAALLIPLMFIDATKSFAQNLIRLLLSYFFKILLVVMITFFVLGMYIDSLNFNFANGNTNSVLTFMSLLSTLLMGIMMSLGAPKLANSVLNGNPSMGVGDISRIAQGAAHAAHTAEHGIKTAAKVGKEFTQGAAKGAVSGLATLNGASDAANRVRSAAELERQAGHSTASDRQISSAANGAFWGTIGNAIRQSVGDKAYKAAFGSERPHLDENMRNNGKLQIGQKFVDENGKEKVANLDDVRNSLKHLATNPEQQAKDKLSKYDREQDSDKGIEDALERKIELPEDNGF